jgi:DNA-binding NtrC family response regulator
VRIEAPATVVPGDIVRVGSTLLLVQRIDERRGRSRHPTLWGVSPRIVDVVEQIERVAARETTVLLHGETGTGKELAARALHDASGRRGRFCAVNCAGISDHLIESELFGHEKGAFSGATTRHVGLAESADGGTLFLDEIGDASPALQSSLLRFVQEGEVRRVGAASTLRVDVRVVAATHRDLRNSAAFREDLYARLARVVIELPPLRDRIEDVPSLTRRFVQHYAGELRAFDPRLMLAMLRHVWPRNVRELQAFVERAVIDAETGPLRATAALQRLLAPPDRATHAPDEPLAAPPVRRAVRPSDQELWALVEEHEGNVTAVAAQLGAGRNTVYRWLKRAGVQLSKYRT